MMPFSCAMPSMLSNASRCAGATGGDHRHIQPRMRASGAISPGWFMPISITAKAVSAGIRASVSGTPQWFV